MNVMMVLFIVAITIMAIGFLVSRCCHHVWQNVDEFSSGKYKTFVQRCNKCGNLRTKKLKVR